MHAKNQARGAALLVCIFVMAMCTAVVVAVLETEMLQMTAVRHTLSYESALYLAGAGAHHALAELEADPAWRTGIPPTEFPSGSGNTYSVTVVDGGSGVIVTGVGIAGGVTRKVQLTVETG
jgi:hypothetical protein